MMIHTKVVTASGAEESARRLLMIDSLSTAVLRKREKKTEKLFQKFSDLICNTNVLIDSVYPILFAPFVFHEMFPSHVNPLA